MNKRLPRIAYSMYYKNYEQPTEEECDVLCSMKSFGGYNLKETKSIYFNQISEK